MPVLTKESIYNARMIISPKSMKPSQIYFAAKNRHRNASLTVEAALVLPFFFFLFFFLWQCFLLLMFQLKVCEQVAETAINFSPMGYIQQEGGEELDVSMLYEPLLWSSIPENERVKNIWISSREDGNKTIQVKVTYEFVCEAVFFATIKLPVEQNFCFYPYRGEGATEKVKKEEPQKDVVYVTEHGTVYHESRACVYLNVTLYAVAPTQVADQRNAAGEKYSECERCKEETEMELVFLSKGGNRYHRSLNCPAVKRNVQEKNRNEIGNLPACHKCKTEEVTE